jgi:hypothetical protein
MCDPGTRTAPGSLRREKTDHGTLTPEAWLEANRGIRSVEDNTLRK